MPIATVTLTVEHDPEGSPGYATVRVTDAAPDAFQMFCLSAPPEVIRQHMGRFLQEQVIAAALQKLKEPPTVREMKAKKAQPAQPKALLFESSPDGRIRWIAYNRLAGHDVPDATTEEIVKAEALLWR